MGDKSKIEWTDATWNVLTGCDPVSPGCLNCYAALLSATRLASSPKYEGVAEMRDGRARFTGLVRTHPDPLDQPLRWTRPRTIFVNSMSDTFHPAVPADFIAKIFAVMALATEHRFQVLTKRSMRMHTLLNTRVFWKAVYLEFLELLDSDSLSIPDEEDFVDDALRGGLPNVWMAVSAEDQKRYDERIVDLIRTPAAVRFLSCEPLLSDIDLRLEECLDPNDHYAVDERIHQVIVGGESGSEARPMLPDWARSLRDQCAGAGVAFFFKQTGSMWARGLGISGKGGELEELPDEFRVRQYPPA